MLILGAGSIGLRHVRNLLALGVLPSELIVADARPQPLEALRPYRVRTVQASSPQAAIATLGGRYAALDGVAVCTPAAHHAEAVSWAVANRFPFFLEKPPTLALASLTEAEWTTDVPHVVGWNWRWHHDYWPVAGLAGTAHHLLITCDTDMATWPGDGYAHPLAECSHDIDLALHWLGDASDVSASRCGADYTIRMRHVSGQTSTVQIRTAAPKPRRSVETFHVDGRRLFVAHLGAALARSYVDEMQHFRKVVRGGPSASTLADASRVVAVLEEASEMLDEPLERRAG